MPFPTKALHDLHQLSTSKSFEDFAELAESLEPIYTDQHTLPHLTNIRTTK